MSSQKNRIIDDIWKHVVNQLSISQELVLPGDIRSYIGNEGVYMITQRFSDTIHARASVFDDNNTNTIRILPPPIMNGSNEKSTESAEETTSTSTKPKQKIPRPPNAFILYRQHFHPSMKKQFPNLHNNELSVIIGNKWKAEEPAIKQKFKDKAEELKKAHVLKYPDYQYQPRKANEKKRRMTKRKAALMKAKSINNDSGGSTNNFMLDLPKFDSQSACKELTAFVSTLNNQTEQHQKPIFSLPDDNGQFTIQLGEISPERANFLRDLNEKIMAKKCESNMSGNDYLVQSISETPATAFDESLCRATSNGFMCENMSKFFIEDEEYNGDLGSYTPTVRAARCIQDLVNGPYDISEYLHSDPYINARIEEFANLERQRQIASEITLNNENSSHMVGDIYENERTENPQAFDPYFENQGVMSPSGQVSVTHATGTFDSLNYNASPATQTSVDNNSTALHNNVILDPELAFLDNNVSNGTVSSLPFSSTATGNGPASTQTAVEAPQDPNPIANAQNHVVGPNEMSELESMLLELQAEADDQEQGVEVADFNTLFVDGAPVLPMGDEFSTYEHM